MTSRRRLARARLDPSFERPKSVDPTRCFPQVIDHKLLGRVVIRWQGNEVLRVRTEFAPFPPDRQNSFSRMSGERFGQVLDMLGIRY